MSGKWLAAVCCNTGSARGSCCLRLAEYSTLAQPVPPDRCGAHYVGGIRVKAVGCDKLAAVRVAASTRIMASAGTPACGRMSGKWSAAVCCNTGSARGSCCLRLAEYSTLAQPVPPDRLVLTLTPWAHHHIGGFFATASRRGPYRPGQSPCCLPSSGSADAVLSPPGRRERAEWKSPRSPVATRWGGVHEPALTCRPA